MMIVRILIIKRNNIVDIGYFCFMFLYILYVLDIYLLFFILNIGLLYNMLIYFRKIFFEIEFLRSFNIKIYFIELKVF